MPERLPRVGERPAGAETGDDLVMAVLRRAAGDLGWRVRLGVELCLSGSLAEVDADAAGVEGAAALVRTKEEAGLSRASLRGEAVVVPLERLAKRTGSTFSESSSTSRSSALRLPLLGGATAGEGASAMWQLQRTREMSFHVISFGDPSRVGSSSTAQRRRTNGPPVLNSYRASG